MDASQYDLYPHFPIGVGDSVSPQGSSAEHGDSDEIDVLETPLSVNGCDEVVGEGDFNPVGSEGGNKGQGKAGNTCVFLRGWRDEFQFQRPTPDRLDLT